MNMMEKKSLSESRVRASETIYKAFNSACVIACKYDGNGAFAYAVYPDGVKEYMYVSYSNDDVRYGQHEYAMSIIQGCSMEEQMP